MTLNSETSDVASNFTLPQGTNEMGEAGTGPGLSGWNREQYNTANLYINEDNVEYGGYYTWFAATAGEGTFNMSTGDVKQSICPKSWRLPKASDFVTIAGKYTPITAQQAPANFIKSGYCDGACPQAVGSGSIWWSSTAGTVGEASQIYANDIHLNDNSFSRGAYYKGVGRSVRCISRE